MSVSRNRLQIEAVILGVILGANFVNSINQCGNIFRCDIWSDAMAEVEHMAIAMTEISEDAADFFSDYLRIGRHDGGIHIALQCDSVTDLLACNFDVYRPVQADGVTTGIRDFR